MSNLRDTVSELKEVLSNVEKRMQCQRAWNNSVAAATESQGTEPVAPTPQSANLPVQKKPGSQTMPTTPLALHAKPVPGPIQDAEEQRISAEVSVNTGRSGPGNSGNGS